MDTATIQQTLNKALLKLNPSGTWPVNLSVILSRLGIGLCYEEKKGRAESHLELRDPPAIILYRQNPSVLLSTKERFSIAHELAHWIVWRRFGFLPSSETYWNHETLCNEFAAELLVPPRALHQFIERLHREKVNPIYFPEKVKNSAAVSWDVAARSITSTRADDSAYLLLTKVRDVNEPSNVSSFKQSIKFKVNSSSLKYMPGAFVGNGGLLKAEQDLLQLMNELPYRVLENRPSTLSSGNLRLTNVPCTFLRIIMQRTDFWVIHYCPSDKGVLAESSYKVAQSN